jgi:hypothetical protein
MAMQHAVSIPIKASDTNGFQAKCYGFDAGKDDGFPCFKEGLP